MEDNKPETEGQTENNNRQVSYTPGKPFSSTNQPSGEAKSLGWWKKRKGRHLLRTLLEQEFDGTMTDPATGQKMDNKLKREVAQYMNIPIEAVTVEMVLFVKQIALAAQKNDTSAFNTIIDNAYGKPKETFQLFDDKKPQLVFNLAFPKEATSEADAFPPIDEEEKDENSETNNTEDNEKDQSQDSTVSGQ